VNQKLTLLRNGEPLPDEVVATEGQLTGSVRYLFDYVSRMLKLTPSQRQRRFHELADRLRLEHLPTFLEDVATRPA